MFSSRVLNIVIILDFNLFKNFCHNSNIFIISDSVSDIYCPSNYFLCSFTLLYFWLQATHAILDNKTEISWLLAKVLCYLGRSWSMLNVGCRYRCQRPQNPFLSLFMSSVDLGLPQLFLYLHLATLLLL